MIYREGGVFFVCCICQITPNFCGIVPTEYDWFDNQGLKIPLITKLDYIKKGYRIKRKASLMRDDLSMVNEKKN